MDRLTIWEDNYRGGNWASHMDASVNDLCAKLAAYEDTGLTPDEIDALRDENDRLCAALKLAQTRAADMETEFKHLVDANRTMETEVERLRAELERLTAELAAMTARAEAAERDIVWMLTANPAELCIVCKHLTSDICMVGNCHNADWRGPCAENGGTK